MTQTLVTPRRDIPTAPSELTRTERVTRGMAARAEVTRSSHAEFTAGPDRAAPRTLLTDQGPARVPELPPIRYLVRIEALTDVPLRSRRPKNLARTVAKARTKDQLGALDRFAGVENGVPRRNDEAPLVVPIRDPWGDIAEAEELEEGLRQLLRAYCHTFAPEGMRAYGEACGWALARGHVRAGDAVAMAAHLGSGPSFDLAVREFAEKYADQNERDHPSLVSAMAAGGIEARAGVSSCTGPVRAARPRRIRLAADPV
jgi:hypothetical protein